MSLLMAGKHVCQFALRTLLQEAHVYKCLSEEVMVSRPRRPNELTRGEVTLMFTENMREPQVLLASVGNLDVKTTTTWRRRTRWRPV